MGFLCFKTGLRDFLNSVTPHIVVNSSSNQEKKRVGETYFKSISIDLN